LHAGVRGTVCGDDAEILERASFLYDSLYAHLRKA
jgi:hypothetical protein